MIQHGPRKRRITPLQNAILWMTEEAGSESLLTVIITLAHQFPASERDLFLWQVQEALRGLLRLGWITLGPDYYTPDALPLSLAEATALKLPALIAWDDTRQQWVWQDDVARPGELEVILTAEGRAALNR